MCRICQRDDDVTDDDAGQYICAPGTGCST